MAEEQIPVQTGGNCGLFSIISAMRAFGFHLDALRMLEDAMDRFVETSDETFQGEIFSVDLMLRIINGILFDGHSVLDARAELFSSPTQLELLLQRYKTDDAVTLLIGYTKPDEYDYYYYLRGQYLNDIGKGVTGSVSDKHVSEALEKSIGVGFLVKDAHWGMVNTILPGGLINIADSISESKPDSGHGYNTLIGLHSLHKSNLALSNPFDWSKYFKEKRQEISYKDLRKEDKVKYLELSPHYKKVSQTMKEGMDLTGKLVVVRVTEYGKQYL